MQVLVEQIELGYVLGMYSVHVQFEVVLLSVVLAAIEALIRILVAFVLLMSVQSTFVLVRFGATIAAMD